MGCEADSARCLPAAFGQLGGVLGAGLGGGGLHVDYSGGLWTGAYLALVHYFTSHSHDAILSDLTGGATKLARPSPLASLSRRELAGLPSTPRLHRARFGRASVAHRSASLADQTQAQRLEYGLVLAAAIEFFHGVVDMQHGGTLADAQDRAHLPRRLARLGPVQGLQLTRGE